MKNNYKKFLNTWISWLKNDSNYVFGIFCATNMLILFNFIGGSPWPTLFVFSLITILTYLKIKDLEVALMLMTIYTFQFYVPNKYYPVEVFRSSELLNGVGSYLLSYGLNLKDIFLTVMLVVILKNNLGKDININNYNFRYLVIVMFSGYLYFAVSLYSSLRYSHFQTLSFVWLLHYIQLFSIGILGIYLYIYKKNKFKLINQVIVNTIFLQAAISFVQFVKQSSGGFAVESASYISSYFGSSDAIPLLARVSGTFGQANQFAIVMIVLIVISLPKVLSTQSFLGFASVLAGLIAIFLSQSRSAWLSLIPVAAVALLFYKNEFKILFAKIQNSRVIKLLLFLAYLSIIVVFLRLVASLNISTQTGGWTLRNEMLKEGMTAFFQNPLVGYGVGMNEVTLLSIFPRGYNYTFPAPVHNAYVQILLESGALGLAAFLFPFIYTIRCIVNYFLLNNSSTIMKYKDSFFVSLAGIFSFGVFYIFQPHEGIRDFYFLGLILMYCLISIHLMFNNKT